MQSDVCDSALSMRHVRIKGDPHMKQKGILVTSVALAVSAGPWAAAAAATTAATDQGPSLEEVVITATKRESTVQDTPISVTAISAADIANKGLTDFNSLAQTVPGIAMRTSGPGQTEFEM